MRHSLLLALMIATSFGGGSCSNKVSLHEQAPIAGLEIQDLIGSPDTGAFEVVFSYLRGAPGGGTGLFVWRQASGRRRWDAVSNAGYAQGLFLVNSGFPAGREIEPTFGRDCGWDGLRDGSTVASPSVSCGGEKSGVGLFGALSASLRGRVVRFVEKKAINSISADCYSIATPLRSEATVCVDPVRKIPLSFEGSDGEERHQVVAIVVMPEAPRLAQAIDDATTMGPGTERTNKPLGLLDLPRAILDQLRP